MSDPLSVAGSAVGIISLGIQVCQSLISYLQSFKGQDQDIQDSLNDVQTVVSILYSLKGILPKVDKTSSETPAIRRCLAGSEAKLRELQQFSLKLRGTQSPGQDVLGKMDHTRHALLYPFREGKLKSLCQSLNGLIQNLTLSLNISSLDIAVGIHTNVDDLGNAFKVQGANVAKLSDQLQLLDNSMLVYYQDLKAEISQAQLFTQDFRQEIGGQLKLINTDIGSLMSINQRQQEDINQCLMKAFDELKEQNNFQNELIRSTLGMDKMSIQNVGSRQATAFARTRDSKQFAKNPPGCTCKRQHKYSTFSYRFWHATFEYKQHSHGKHGRGCKYFGIDQPTNRIAKSKIPLKLGFLSSRLFLTCIEYSLGTATPGMFIRYKSIVPGSHSPVYDVLNELSEFLERRLTRATENEISLRFAEAERAILCLYRDGESSPYDQDEDGNSHALVALDRTLEAIPIRMLLGESVAQSILESLSLSAKRLTETLVSAAGDENGKLQVKNPQAIFQESLKMLEIALAKSPGGVTERIHQLTTVQLCVCWPKGLRMLLRTRAVEVMDELDLEIAVGADCIESVDMLLKAGCPVNYGDQTEYIFRIASERCMDVIASNLARRRSDLLSLSQQHQVVCQDLVLTSDIPDDQASYLCSCLDKSGISIPLALRVPSSYSTIYHFDGTSIYHYPILFRNGFTHLSSHNILGLLPTMTRNRLNRPRLIRADSWRLIEGIDWLNDQRILDHIPTDPFNLGLNIQATGWHYQSICGNNWYPPVREFLYKKAKDVLGDPVLDKCRCWCTPSGTGCTPLTTALKSYVKHSIRPSQITSDIARCNFFHTSIRDTASSGSRITGWCDEVIRFLTFEALEMTHTCCEFSVIDRPEISSEQYEVLINCEPERWQKIRSDKREQENVALLENLMEEFIAYMMHMSPSPRSLEIFVNSYWRHRMSDIYAVDLKEIKDIKNCLVGTKTYVLPDRVKLLLGEDFKLVELQDLKSKPTPVGKISLEEKFELGGESLGLLSCDWCRWISE
ncbi:unnamed protein product [Fusarium fujikuroi]|nr:uncharacterized protein FFE2_11052 [Fusarium fujikuroi]VTT64305.1 unnamed protein product [Fusarium fujikuroi]